MTITKANADVGRKVRIVGSIGHCLAPRSIGIIEEVVYPEFQQWAQVRGRTNDGKECVQLLDKDDYVFVD